MNQETLLDFIKNNHKILIDELEAKHKILINELESKIGDNNKVKIAERQAPEGVLNKSITKDIVININDDNSNLDDKEQLNELLFRAKSRNIKETFTDIEDKYINQYIQYRKNMLNNCFIKNRNLPLYV